MRNLLYGPGEALQGLKSSQAPFPLRPIPNDTRSPFPSLPAGLRTSSGGPRCISCRGGPTRAAVPPLRAEGGTAPSAEGAAAGSRAAGAALPAAPGLGCASDWVGYRNMCYHLSLNISSWNGSQAQCSQHGASLAMLQEEWEMEFLQRLQGDLDCWVGVRRQGEHLERVDGSNFTFRVSLQGVDPCLTLIHGHLRGASCSDLYPYICSKPLSHWRSGLSQAGHPQL
ncbi:C-type lectin domain family 2 member D3-like [Colius striatus]|uniref:C-type lectin domain family 2 member D3-like n=1 Tax=Colius striatus TaxID=57412 RepID=UPI002B1E15BA|nr:C-type lectin domain family 2 member D3-like [Colius striatus]